MAIPIKDESGIARMREAGAIASTALYQLSEHVEPGITTYDLDQIGRELMAGLGARSACYGYQHGSRRFPAHTCLSVNEEVVHGIGSMKRVLQDGDIIALDIVVEYQGYIGDNAMTVPVGTIDDRRARLLRVSEESLRLGIAQAQVGNRIGDISHAIQTHVEKHGFSVVRDMVGHGVGIALHEPPQIPNFGRRGQGDLIRPGMTLAIEPMVNAGTWRVRTRSDGWTITTTDGSDSAHFEHTVLTAEPNPEILTIPRLDSAPPIHALAAAISPS